MIFKNFKLNCTFKSNCFNTIQI